MNKLLIEINKLNEQKIDYVIITLVNIIGSAPQNLGAKMLVTPDGLRFGTVGGGKVETRAILHSQEMLKDNVKFDFKEWNLQKDIGMSCGGVSFFSFEAFSFISNFKIAIFGAGHVAQEVIKVLSNIDCSIICIDPRMEWLDRLPNYHNLKKICIDPMESVVETLSEESFIVSLTMGHAFDRPILSKALKTKFPYVACIGSNQKALVIKKELASNDGLTSEEISKLICPIGEKFGSNDPYEIAISITAQLLKYRDLKI